ncbi:sulfotransferase domain-containing protein [Pseudohoeflea coraliihabitans]|uniref:Sulfotransferase domain-containing protein n=1 Tax=Pseudohoeflea coraliihabitans TaxID=2860393 RepID=A0ABS6WLG2_9HYPH|nr:sulfotransferase domain-containing protein [Pseudohoeflea sp. DP4N28-3]MBW3095970.1 sulfotransferase domain-containing protein [Pseudohoeflea sp. DP4N28-3]
MKVDFFIIGVQKAGTTALASLLAQHPSLQLPARKELHVFDKGVAGVAAQDRFELKKHFDWTVEDVMRGEATPIYCYWPGALERLQDYNSQARLILILRHPAFRAYSQWRMARFRGIEPLSFEEAVSDKGRRRVVGAPHGVKRKFSYVERGFYGWQVERLLSLFKREQILFVRTDTFWSQPLKSLQQVEDFLGAPRWLRENVQPRYIVPVENDDTAPMAPRARERLTRLFAEDIMRTGHLTGLDLSDWLDAAYREPMPSPWNVSAGNQAEATTRSV